MKDKGLGDTIERFTKATGIKKMVDKVAGEKDCGCNKRKNKLNNMFPYSDQKKNSEDNINDFSEEMLEDLDKYPKITLHDGTVLTPEQTMGFIKHSRESIKKINNEQTI
jgi:hypothetical protein